MLTSARKWGACSLKGFQSHMLKNLEIDKEFFGSDYFRITI